MEGEATTSSAGVNLNSGFPQFDSAKALYEHIRKITKPNSDFTVRNFVGVIKSISPPERAVVETELFPKAALEFYAKKNLCMSYSSEEESQWMTNERGGEQGDYTDGMLEKIANVVSCLKECPRSKRAVITIPFSTQGSKFADWKDQGQSKCVRELHFYIEEGKLKCTGILRMQNANIFPKNIYFFALLIHKVASQLNLQVGEYTHWITNLCHDRSPVGC